MPRYTIKVPLSVNGMRDLKKKISTIERNVPKIEQKFIKKSVDFMEERAKFYIRTTTGGSSWYQLTHTLENSFLKDYQMKKLINYCFYSAYVEFGTGIIGKGTHPQSQTYQYDVNNHGDNGWYFFDDNGNLHWTKGMKAHAYMYNTVVDYFYKEEYKRLFNEAANEVLGGILK